MLNYFFTRHKLPVVNTRASYPLSLKSSAEYKGKTIPFDRIYVSFHTYFKLIKTNLGDEANKLAMLSEQSIDYINSDKRFPSELKQLKVSSMEEFQSKVSDKESINIVVLNGIGTGFGDNYIGLGLMQFIKKIIAPTKVTFHLMQKFSSRIAPVYMREENILIYNGCISVRQWFDMDYYVDLVGMLGFKGFDDMPLIHFYAEQFGMKKIIKNNRVLPVLTIDQKKSDTLDYFISTYFAEQRPIILLHHQASSPLRSMPDSVLEGVIDSLISQGFNVVSAVACSHKSDFFCDLSHLSSSVDDLIHIANAVDAVISVGTVLYHVSAALGKPTWLLPTVQADIDSASIYEEVTVWLDENTQKFISQKHRSRQDEDIKQAAKIWSALDSIELSKSILSKLCKE